MQIAIGLESCDKRVYIWSLNQHPLYLFLDSSQKWERYLILPNEFADVEQYKAQIEHTIPNDKALYQFVSDAKGKEKVYILATSKPIGVARISAIFHKESNQALRVASAKSMESFSKDMQVIAKEEKIEYAIKELEIEVN